MTGGGGVGESRFDPPVLSQTQYDDDRENGDVELYGATAELNYGRQQAAFLCWF